MGENEKTKIPDLHFLSLSWENVRDLMMGKSVQFTTERYDIVIESPQEGVFIPRDSFGTVVSSKG